MLRQRTTEDNNSGEINNGGRDNNVASPFNPNTEINDGVDYSNHVINNQPANAETESNVLVRAFDETFYVDEYAARDGQPKTWKTRVKAYIEWPAGKGIAPILGFVLFGFLLALLKNPFKFIEALLLSAVKGIEELQNSLKAKARAQLHIYPNETDEALMFGKQLGLIALKAVPLFLHLAVRATLSPVASYEAAKKEGGTLLGLVSIAFSTLFITGSLLLLGPFALFIAGKIAGPLAVQTLTLLMAELIAKLGMTSFVANVAGFLGLNVAPVAASMCVAAAVLVIATIHRLPTLIAGIFTGFGFFGGGAGGKGYNELPNDDGQGNGKGFIPKSGSNPNLNFNLKSSNNGNGSEKDEFDNSNNQSGTSAYGNPNGNAAAINKLGLNGQQGNGSSTSVVTDPDALNNNSLPLLSNVKG